MPIYAYRCEECGFQKDALQKLSDPPLVDCPQCGKPKLAKQVTAAGFALKGTGWYVTDFRDSAKKTASGTTPSDTASAAAGASSTATTQAATAASSGSSSAVTPSPSSSSSASSSSSSPGASGGSPSAS